MIKVTDTVGANFWLNRNNIESLIRQDDGYTLITMTGGAMHLAEETPVQIIGTNNV